MASALKPEWLWLRHHQTCRSEWGPALNAGSIEVPRPPAADVLKPYARFRLLLRGAPSACSSVALSTPAVEGRSPYLSPMAAAHRALSTATALQAASARASPLSSAALARAAAQNSQYSLTLYLSFVDDGRAASAASSDMNGKQSLPAASSAEAVAGPMPCSLGGPFDMASTAAMVAFCSSLPTPPVPPMPRSQPSSPSACSAASNAAPVAALQLASEFASALFCSPGRNLPRASFHLMMSDTSEAAMCRLGARLATAAGSSRRYHLGVTAARLAPAHPSPV
mmetsp:Transcript_17868/g.45794  ORF Transcript_17868/g.45794 Transcript_17868/m.45794 type:complete len:282 (+) Transcript_17868:229-1074(+)